MSDALQRIEGLQVRISSFLAEAALSVMGYGSLRPLPSPHLPIPGDVRCLADLWDHVESIPRRHRDESAFRSTIRVAKGDLWRKWADQYTRLARNGPAPPGFERIEGLVMGPPRAPLHALFRPPQPTKPIVIVAHGFFDSKLSRYLLFTAEALVRLGIGVLAPDMRWHGCLLSRDWLPTLGIEEGLDLLEWGRWLQRRHPGHPVGLVGFSLGALDVIHAFSHDPAAEILQAGGIAVSPPASLRQTLRTLDQRARLVDLGLNAFLRRFFQNALTVRMKELGLDVSGRGVFARFLEWMGSHRALGSDLTAARLLGRADLLPLLQCCRRPLLVLASDNDPVYLERTAIPLAEGARDNPFVRVIETSGGGHIGQLGTYPQWMADVFNQFFGLAPQVAGGEIRPGMPGA